VSLLLLAILELAEVHELGDGGLRERSDLDQVDILLLGEPQRFANRNDAELLTFLADQADFSRRDLAVDALRTILDDGCELL
jgi:hypothetical protein